MSSKRPPPRSATIATRTNSENITDTSQFLRLPEELIHHVLMYLDARSVLSCTAVCHTLQDIVKQSPSLQYHIELFSDHLIQGEFPQGSPAELLRRLLKSRSAWDHLTPTSTETVELDGAKVYNICDGLWLNMKPRVYPGHIRTIFVGELPASTHLEHRMQKISVELDLEAADVMMVPSQDLLIVLQDQAIDRGPILHLRTLSGNIPHPDAAKPMLESPRRSRRSGRRSTTALYGDSIALTEFPDNIFTGKPGAVVWWNWKTGDIIRNYPDGSSSIFLSSAHLAVLVFKGQRLAFHIISSEQEVSDSHPLCILSFPSGLAGITLPYAFASDNSYFSMAPSSPISRDRPIRIDSTSDLICVKIFPFGRPNYLAFFRRNTLLERAVNLSNVSPTQEFKWEHWATDISRLVEAPIEHTCQGCIHGLKFVTQASQGYYTRNWGPLMPQEFDEDSKKKDLNGLHLFMLDFNPRPISRGLQSFSNELVDHCVVEEETVLKEWQTEDVVSRMPFRAVMSKTSLGSGFINIVVECENLVGVGTTIHENEDLEKDEMSFFNKIRTMTF